MRNALHERGRAVADTDDADANLAPRRAWTSRSRSVPVTVFHLPPPPETLQLPLALGGLGRRQRPAVLPFGLEHSVKPFDVVLSLVRSVAHELERIVVHSFAHVFERGGDLGQSRLQVAAPVFEQAPSSFRLHIPEKSEPEHELLTSLGRGGTGLLDQALEELLAGLGDPIDVLAARRLALGVLHSYVARGGQPL